MDKTEQKKIIRSHFHNKLGDPKDIFCLLEYINLCVDTVYENSSGSDYHNHHILPKSRFDEFKDLKKFIWNSSRLHARDHGKAHVLLAKAYPIMEFILPTNYISGDKIPLVGSLMWDFMYSNPDVLNQWKRKKSDHMKSVMQPGNPRYERWIESLRKRWDDPEERIKVAKHFSDLHLDPEYKKKAIENAKKSRQENMKKWRESCSSTWESEEYRQKLRDILGPINKDADKRKHASEKIKELWTTNEFREKSLNSRAEGNKKRKEAGVKRSNSDKMKENWANPEIREKILAKRKATREAKKNL